MVHTTYTKEEERHHVKVVAKDVFFHAVIVCLFAYVATRNKIEDPEDLRLESSLYKVITAFLMVVQIGYAWSTLLTLMKDKRQDKNYHLKEVVGHFCFLTHVTFSVLTVYTTFGFIVHTANYFGVDAPILYKTENMLHCISLSVDTLGLAVTFLFLRLCWYEKNWVIMMKEIEKRIPNILQNQMITHLVPLVHVFVDLFIFRDGTKVLKYGGSARTLTFVFAVIGVLFQSYLELLYYATGGCYPYPVLYKLNTLFKKLLFFVVVWLFTSFLAISLLFLLGVATKYY